MTLRGRKFIPAVAVVIAAAGILAGGLALRPAFAVNAKAVAPFALVTCTSGSPCQTFSNQGHGIALEGVNSNKSSSGVAVEGSITGMGTAVEGLASSGAGVLGLSTDGIGIFGQGEDEAAGSFYSNSGTGLSATTTDGTALYAISAGSFGLLAYPGNGIAIDATSNTTGYVVVADSTSTTSGIGLQTTAPYIGAVSRAEAGSGFPIVATNAGSTDLFWIDGVGDAHAYGYDTTSKTRTGDVAVAYSPTSTTPTIEDDGTARLVDGTAVVHLDRAFAQSIDLGTSYHVTLTSDGDTLGLYVASETPTDFVVREAQGGRDTLDFDYHISTAPAGESGARMAKLSEGQAQKLMPYAPLVRPHVSNKGVKR